MTYTKAIGLACNKVILLIVRGLALSKIHPNVLTFLGLVIHIVAAALLAGCDTLYTEDLKNGRVFDGQLTVVNPFVAA